MQTPSSLDYANTTGVVKVARRILKLSLFIVTALMMKPASAVQSGIDGDPLWQDFLQSMNSGLPQSALGKLDAIAARAEQSGDVAEKIRVLITRIDLEANLAEASKPDTRLKKLRAAIDSADPAMQPVLEMVQATWMLDFFQQNRWRFSQRTAVASNDAKAAGGEPTGGQDGPFPRPDDDLLTWDLARILQAVDDQFSRALRAADQLKGVSIEGYRKLLVMGNVPALYRPTMYDVLVHHALQFYTAGEQAGSKSIHAFDLLADSPVFGNQQEFLEWQPKTADQRAPLLVAVKLYQDLIRFHLVDEDPTARLDADLARLQFANSHAVGEGVSERYWAALQAFQSVSSDHPIWARVTAIIADLTNDAGQPAKAREIALQAIERFPESVGANQAYNLVQQIESREVQVSTERVWNAPWPEIQVRYRNVNKAFFRLVPFDFTAFASSPSSWSPESVDENQVERALKAKPVKSWSADLPETSDYRSRVERLPTPQDVKPGSYYLLCSHREDFSDADNQISICEIWVSNLSLVVTTQQGEGTVAGHVLDARTGSPIAGAMVQAWQYDRQGNRVVEIPAVRTNASGEFSFQAGNRQRMALLVTSGDQRLGSANMIQTNMYRDRSAPQQVTQFFTDRSIYRPGQTIRFKGISYSFDQNKDSYQTLAKLRVVIGLFDVNNKEVERIEQRTNEFGSFSGSFTAPRGKLTGVMWLRVLDGPNGQANVRVEEYKRPKFEVEISPPEVAPKLNELTEVQGKAMAYTGAAIDQATVQWRVVREVRYPAWWYWRMWWLPPQNSSGQEIARGTANTQADGTFKINFQARPDLSVSPESEPTFSYAIYADVTDGTGETRSTNRSINVGYTALAATISSEGWLTTERPVELNLRTLTLDGQGQSAQGTVKIYNLKQPTQVTRRRELNQGNDPFEMPDISALASQGQTQPPVDWSNPDSWPLGEVVYESKFTTDAAGAQTLQVELASGIYRVVLATQDRFGKPVNAELPLKVFDLTANRLEIKLPFHFQAQQASVEPGETFRAVWASGYENARAFVEVEHRGKLIQRFWTDQGKTQQVIQLPVTEEMRGGFTVHLMMVRENRAYLESLRVEVPWSNKELEIKWERFTSKLEPAQREKWTAIISGRQAERVAAEMVATLYDASLDAFAPHPWMQRFGVFRLDYSRLNRQFANVPKNLQHLRYNWVFDQRDELWQYPELDLPGGGFGRGGGYGFGRGGGFGMMFSEAAPGGYLGGPVQRGARLMDSPKAAFGVAGAETNESLAFSAGEAAPASAPASDAFGAEKPADGSGAPNGAAGKLPLDGLPVRVNLNETAFFFPHVVSRDDGAVQVEFTMPEALTRWRFMGFAHDSQLRGGFLTDVVTTSKDLMIQPNAPRFLREGDVIEFTIKVTNASPTRQTGQAGLALSDSVTGQSLNSQLGIDEAQLAFDIPAGASQSLAWRLRVPDGLTMVTYRAMASTGRISDGEEGFLPVLSRRILVTESLPLAIRGKQTKDYTFDRLGQSQGSSSLKHQSLTVQMASNPSWYAVMSLPYLMEYPHQCSEQIFSRLYANALAQRIATSDPKIEKVFAQWRGTPALDSPLEKNQDLKAITLEESPWLRQAESESQSRRNMGILFDQNRLADEISRALGELSERQLPDGRWSWFPGGMPSDFITLYITTGFGRLQHLGVKIDAAPAIRSLAALDQWMSNEHQRALEIIKKSKQKADDKPANFLNHYMALYFYGRSFFAAEHPVAPPHQESLKFWLNQAKLYWLDQASLQSQAQLAIALHRFGDKQAAQAIMQSLKERSLNHEEMGTYWRTAENFYWWYHAPIESQATLIEAFDEVARDAEMVENCKVWLLKQKQTQHWKTTKATADAVYALLLRGTDVLASDQPVVVSLAGQAIRPSQVEAGTGFYEHRIVGSDVNAALSDIQVTKQDDGVAWGSVHWQYFENLDNITADSNNPLRITKELYVKQNTDSGPQLTLVGQGGQAAGLAVGDELVVRLVLSADRDLEYVHLKDHRGSGTEPVNVLSGYRYQDGLGYYESTRDAASHFFIEYLRKGTYVFEYSSRVQLRGDYQTGMAQVQCMYAPEFNSHSQSIRLQVE